VRRVGMLILEVAFKPPNTPTSSKSAKTSAYSTSSRASIKALWARITTRLKWNASRQHKSSATYSESGYYNYKYKFKR